MRGTSLADIEGSTVEIVASWTHFPSVATMSGAREVLVCTVVEGLDSIPLNDAQLVTGVRPIGHSTLAGPTIATQWERPQSPQELGHVTPARESYSTRSLLRDTGHHH